MSFAKTLPARLSHQNGFSFILKSLGGSKQKCQAVSKKPTLDCAFDRHLCSIGKLVVTLFRVVRPSNVY